MTAFALVSGGHVGGWVWRETAARLRRAGSEAYPATLTGLGDRRHLAGPGTDLDTHIEDLVQLIDHTDDPALVLVGHCYGIYPAVGAADRRPERIARVVYLDAPLPQDGYSMFDQVREQMADAATRERMLGQAERAEDGWRVPPPSLEEWRRWGNVADVPAEELARLARLAAPHPLGTMTRPLRLSGAAAGLPASGIFCTAGGGMSTAALQRLIDSGDPRVQWLADPRMGFFDLATGHWPMLSAPGELADVLLRATAGEGQRLSAGATPRSGQVR
ncbi:alpha/beta fold hydrolase [Streptomyces sp. HNM0663]|uniref:Alpha/beta fold hydrolase n=1 Tax=Streptomyces chengmaiensis TaxID=3040919 RepID=A0ABT6HYX1_9ACTN|nr:alpha/beta fold hydrolase [Streptomyces chengmaiensis]MDH2393610.1 alpha/beta fold hydrolase [Streptomyces chengmaiensis]